MPDQRPVTAQGASGGFKDAVCIDAGRVYDSCMDRDCLEDLRVYFNDAGQDAIQNAVSCRVKSAEVASVQIDVEPVTFNRGFFSCDITFYFVIKCEVCNGCGRNPEEIVGVASFSKKTILCGGEGSVKTFTSQEKEGTCGKPTIAGNNLPVCKVQCVDPVVLDSRICEMCRCGEVLDLFPDCVLTRIDGNVSARGQRALYATLGLFSIVQLIRDVQMVVPVYDFCMPQKECPTTTENPCDLFSRIKFPTEEFFPSGEECEGCSCRD